MYENCKEEMRLGRRKKSCAEREIMWGRRQDKTRQDRTRQEKTGHERTEEKKGKVERNVHDW